MSRVAPPEALPFPVVDTHAHFDHTRDGDEPFALEQALDAATAVNVTRAVQIGCDLESAAWTLRAIDADHRLVGGVALHPTEASDIATGVLGPQGDPEAVATALAPAWARIERMAAHPRVRVIGETGLDYHWVGAEDTLGRAAQEESFRWHLRLAKRLGKVLQIHDRDAHDDVLAVLGSEGAPDRTVFHCFSGDAALARVCADNGWYLSFAGTVTFAKAEALREALRVVPFDQVLVETDAPYLAPAPHRGRTNASYLVPVTVRRMAEVLDRDLTEVCRQLDATSERLYGPW